MAATGKAKYPYMLGLCLEKGKKGIDVNLQEAFSWYAKAAEKGYPPAQRKLAEMYFYGIGVPHNLKRAQEWLSLAKSDSETARDIDLDEKKHGKLLKVDFKKKKIIFTDEDKASLGDGESLFNVGLDYFMPLDENTKPDYEKALGYFLKAANANYTPAKFQTAYMYECGMGTPVNDKEAFRWYKEAAESGDMDSAHNLGMMYQDGRGTPRNYTLAYKWYKKAADHGCELSCNKIGFLYFFGYGLPKNEEKAFSWYMKSALKGYKYAEYNIGYSYFHGYGVKQNYTEAKKWFLKAANKGHISAAEYLARMTGFGVGTEQNTDEAINWGMKAFKEGSAGAAMLLGQIYHKQKNDVASASFYYNEAIKRGDMNGAFAMASLYLYGENNELHIPDYARALHYFQMLTQKGENYAYEEIGDIYTQLKQYELAKKNYETAIALTGCDGLKGLGDMYRYGRYVKKDQDKALYYYLSYIKNKGYKTYATIREIADIYREKNEPLKAMHWYLKGLPFETSDYGFLKHCHAELLKIYARYDKWTKIIAFVESRKYLKHSDDCQFILGNAYFRCGSYQNAFRCYLKVNSTQTCLRMNAKALLSYMAKNGEGVMKNDVIAEKEEKYAVIEASTYAKYLIGHNFMSGKNGHPVSRRYARLWLTYAAYEGSYEAHVDLADLSAQEKNNVETALWASFLKGKDKKKYAGLRLDKKEKQLLKERLPKTVSEKKMSKAMLKMQKQSLLQVLTKKFTECRYNVLCDVKINGIKIDMLAYNRNVILPIILFKHNPQSRDELVHIDGEKITIGNKNYKSPFARLDAVKVFLEKQISVKVFPVVLAAKNMVFEQKSLILKRRMSVLRSPGEIHQDIDLDTCLPPDKETDALLKTMAKKPFASVIKSFFSKH